MNLRNEVVDVWTYISVKVSWRSPAPSWRVGIDGGQATRLKTLKAIWWQSRLQKVIRRLVEW